MAAVYKGMATGDSAVFELALQGRVRQYAMVNLFILGVCFGLSNLAGALQTTPNLPFDGTYALLTPLIFSTAGVISMSGAMIACVLVYWAAARAFGGQGGFGLIFDLIGSAIIPFWILAPLLNYALRFQVAGVGRILILSGIVASFLWSFSLLRQSIIVGQGLTKTKANIAITMIWIFSVSAIYVFIP
ncbi:MAG: hypothetical protein QNJ17_04755 [Desulfocapsaceae bacterium]|nr:hypothetical protein [Desulfocapsaceae bacterium]